MTAPIRQLESLTSYTADGVTTLWNFSFTSGYLDQSHVKAYTMTPTGVRTELTVTPAMLVGPYQLQVSPPVASGNELTIYRATPTDAPLVDFADRAAFTEVSVDTAIKQSLFAAAEMTDALSVAMERLASVSSYAQQAQDAAAAANASAGQASTSAGQADTARAAAQQAASDANGYMLSAQATAASFNDANIVHKSGAETITGVKTFQAGAQPVGILKASVGLGNVDNTSDVNKPVSTAQQTAINNSHIGMRNRVINGDVRIDQRNSGAANTPTASPFFPVDRWQFGFTQASKFSCGYNLGGGSTPTGFKSYLGFSTAAAFAPTATDAFYVRQLIEGYNVADLAWGTANAAPVTLSFWFYSSVTGTHSGVVGNGSRAYPFTFTVTAANTWEQKVITIPGDTAGSWATDNTLGLFVSFDLGSGANFRAAAGAWGAGNLVGATGAVQPVATAGAVVRFTGVQLEKGSQATPFEVRTFGLELALCQRYYEAGTAYYTSFAASGTAFQRTWASFSVNKRVPPTVGLALTSGGATAPAAFAAYQSGFAWGVSSTAASQEAIVSFTAAAEL